MGDRGRRSAETALMTIEPVEIIKRPTAPHDLTDEEAEVWHAIINSKPADHFGPATLPLLTQYCRHSIHTRRIAELLEKATSDKKLKIQDYRRLLIMLKNESEILARLAMTMRLSQQATVEKTGNKAKVEAYKPWAG